MWRAGVVAAASAVLMLAVVPAPGVAEQAGSQLRRLQAGWLDAGGFHTCARLETGRVRCWGSSEFGQLGYGSTSNIGDDETPDAVGPVNLGADRTAAALAAGGDHTCALLDTGQVRCWGVGSSGQLGYGNTSNIGDDETPDAVGPVSLGAGRTATAIAAGSFHTCAVLDTGQVRCWGQGSSGQLGYASTSGIGDDETPDAVGPVSLGGAATAVAAGRFHTCALLATGQVRCWGAGGNGQLGYASTARVGDDETPDAVGPVSLGGAAIAIAAGDYHTCALLATGQVRCWGLAGNGRLGYGNLESVGDDETPDAVGPVNLGSPAIAIAAGEEHTCAVLDAGQVRCWGSGGNGRLGYGNTDDIGDDETPSTVGPVSLGGAAAAISAGYGHTCALLDSGRVRCWGFGGEGRLGYGNVQDVGDDEFPSAVGPVSLGGVVPGRVADLSLSAAFVPAQVTTGQPSTLAVTVTNGGVDGAGGIAVGVPAPAGVQLSGASPGQGTYAPASGLWSVGTLAPGASATLPLTVTAAQAGQVTAIAEVTASDTYDPDSVPANGVAGEDDRASATLTTVAAPKSPAKIRVLRAGVKSGVLDMLVEITSRAAVPGARLSLKYLSSGRTTRFSVPIPAAAASRTPRARSAETRIKIRRKLPASQRKRNTGIVELTYAGNDRVRPDAVRLRAASGKSKLKRTTTRIENGRLIVSGTITSRARGVVRIRLGYDKPDASTGFLYWKASISRGRWKLDRKLPAEAARGGQLSIQFTGYLPRNLRGEQTAKQVLAR